MGDASDDAVLLEDAGGLEGETEVAPARSTCCIVATLSNVRVVMIAVATGNANANASVVAASRYRTVALARGASASAAPSRRLNMPHCQSA